MLSLTLYICLFPCRIITPVPNPSPIWKKLFSNSPLTKMKLLPVWMSLLLSFPVVTYNLHILIPTVHFTLIPLHSHDTSIWMFLDQIEPTPWVGSLRFPNFLSITAHQDWIDSRLCLFTWMDQLFVGSNVYIETT